MRKCLIIIATCLFTIIYVISAIVVLIFNIVFEVINGLCMCVSVTMARLCIHYFIIDRGYHSDTAFILDIASKELVKLNVDKNSFKWVCMIAMAKLLYHNTCDEYVRLRYMS